MARTAEDLVLLDSVIRNNQGTTTANGAWDNPINCAVDVNRDLNLQGVRIGLPSTFGWVQPGISAEVRPSLSKAVFPEDPVLLDPRNR